MVRRRRNMIFEGLVLVLTLTIAACAPLATGPPAGPLNVTVSGAVDINGHRFEVKARGLVNQDSGSYSLSPFPIASAAVCPAAQAMIAWFPRIATDFLVKVKGDALFDLADREVTITLKGAPKKDLISGVNRLIGVITLTSSGDSEVHVAVNGTIESDEKPCRKLEVDKEGSAIGDSAIRLGMKPTITDSGRFIGGSFVGGARVDFDVSDGDPGAFGGSDFWNLDGMFVAPKSPAKKLGACMETSCKVLSVDVGHLTKDNKAAGTIRNFPSSTVTFRGVFTYSGLATSDGSFHKHIGIANPTGGSPPLLTHFDTPVKAGDTPATLAARTADLINRSSAGSRWGGPLLAVQGGTGVGVSKPDPTSPRVAVCQTRDGQSCVSGEDSVAQQVFPQVGTQLFASAGVDAFRNSGIGEGFGVLNEPPLVGWLTPFKSVFFTNNPETHYLAAGGAVVLEANICRSTGGAFCDPNTTTRVPRFRVPTSAGQSGEDVARAVTRALEEKGVTCIQRVGATVIMDAGFEMPSILFVNSEDRGLGYATQAADIPTLVDPHSAPGLRER